MLGYMVAIAIYVRVVPGQAPEHDEAPRLTLPRCGACCRSR
jgi:C4-dicarboxylate transporter DctM subunit